MTENLQKALNGQITAELWSANLYLSMSFYLEKEGFSGMARWMRKQSAEEQDTHVPSPNIWPNVRRGKSGQGRCGSTGLGQSHRSL